MGGSLLCFFLPGTFYPIRPVPATSVRQDFSAPTPIDAPGRKA
jgi:hypothetical protein